jgi:hypothetical protein
MAIKQVWACGQFGCAHATKAEATKHDREVREALDRHPPKGWQRVSRDLRTCQPKRQTAEVKGTVFIGWSPLADAMVKVRADVTVPATATLKERCESADRLRKALDKTIAAWREDESVREAGSTP